MALLENLATSFLGRDLGLRENPHPIQILMKMEEVLLKDRDMNLLSMSQAYSKEKQGLLQ